MAPGSNGHASRERLCSLRVLGLVAAMMGSWMYPARAQAPEPGQASGPGDAPPAGAAPAPGPAPAPPAPPAPAAGQAPPALPRVPGLRAIPGLVEALRATPAWLFQPSISLQATLTDNARSNDDNRRSDLILQVAPRITVHGNTPRLKLFADYSHRELLYLNDSRSDRSTDSLRGHGTLEAVEGFFFVDAQASVSQRQESAFGLIAADNEADEENTSQVRSFRLSPYIRSRPGARTDYEARYAVTSTDSDSDRLRNRTSELVSGRVSQQLTPFFGLGAQASQYSVSRSDRDDAEIDRYVGTIFFLPRRDLRLSAYAGKERTNLQPDETSTIHGFGVAWRPTPRTDIAAQRDRRFFGTGYRGHIAHRHRRSAIRVAASRDVSTLEDLVLRPTGTTIEDIFADALSGLFPDPVQREQVARALLEQAGVDPDSPLFAAFLTDRLFLEKRVEASVALLGTRNTVSFGVSRAKREPLEDVPTLLDDFGLTRSLRTDVMTASWSRRMTGRSSITGTASRIRNVSLEDDGLHSRRLRFAVTGATRVGTKSTASLQLRHVRFDSSGRDYRENAIIAAFNYYF